MGGITDALPAARSGSSFPSGWAGLGVSGPETQTSKPIWTIALPPHNFSAQRRQTSVEICNIVSCRRRFCFPKGIFPSSRPHHYPSALSPGVGHPRTPPPPLAVGALSSHSSTFDPDPERRASQPKRDALPPTARYDHEVPSLRDSPSPNPHPLPASLKPIDKGDCSMQCNVRGGA